MPAVANLNPLDAPCIQALTLVNVTLNNWNAPIVGRLTSLALKYHPYGPRRNGQPAYSFATALELLAKLTTLTSLKLEGLFHGSNDNAEHPPDNPEQVRLPHLKRLEIRENVTVLNVLLGQFHLPAAEEITLQCDLRSRDNITMYDQQIYHFPVTVGQCLVRAHWPPLRHATFELDEKVRIIARSGDSEEQYTAIRDACRLKIISDTPSLDTGAAFIHPITPIPLCNITTARVTIRQLLSRSSIDTYRVRFWAELSALQELETIELHGHMCDSFVGLLLVFAPSLAVGEYRRRVTIGHAQLPQVDSPFGALRTLTLRKLELAHTMHGQYVLEHLAAFLRRRSDQGRPIDVTIGDCILPELTQEMVESSGIRILPSVEV